MAEPLATTNTPTMQADIPRVAWMVLVYWLAVLALFNETAWSMITTWYRSETFAHGFLIIPISLWLVWNNRAVLGCMQPLPKPSVLLLTAPIGFAWLVASLVDVLVVQQVALVALLIIGVWAILGNAIARVLLFPLLFLFLAVPMGEGLVPPMMELTATSTVWLIKLTGIPVYREGMYFSLPSGNWSVVEACSGVRYLIASFTLGVLFAYLTYRSLRKKLLFVLAAILVPIIANTLRAYIIVMLGHISNMTIATGVDHLIYGWVFFGLVMLLLFWLGSLWREDLQEDDEFDAPPASTGNDSTRATRPFVVMLAAIVWVAVWPSITAAIEYSPTPTAGVKLAAPMAGEGWERQADRAWDWNPISPGVDLEIAQFYRSGDTVVALYLQQYIEQRQGAELASSASKFVEYRKLWRVMAQDRYRVTMNEQQMEVDRVELSGAGHKLLAWSLYRIGDRYTVNPYEAKFLEALAKLSFGRRDAARIVVATEIGEMGNDGETLQAFLDTHLPAIETSLNASVGQMSP